MNDGTIDALRLKIINQLKASRQELAEKPNHQESTGELTPCNQLTTTSSDRQVGMKSKREEEDEEDVEWDEEAPIAANGNYKMDSNVEEEEEEEDVDWEEGSKQMGSTIDDESKVVCAL